jgi:hypothetical protein
MNASHDAVPVLGRSWFFVSVFFDRNHFDVVENANEDFYADVRARRLFSVNLD